MQEKRMIKPGVNSSVPRKQPAIQPPKKKPDYEKLGRLLYAIGETGTTSRKKLYRISFWRGIWMGLGSAIGATIVLSILLWFFTVLGRVPLLGTFIDLVQKSIPQVN